MAIKRRFTYIFNFLRPWFVLFARLKYNYHAVASPALAPDQPALILANHNSAMDPFFLGMSFRRPIFFVASDHIFRLGWISAVIRALVDPIPIVKSQMDLRTLRHIRGIIQDGGLVGLYPEGNRSFNGLTTFISPSIGKLVKQLRCTVILYRYTGGYLTTPRWARHMRRGRMSGQVVRVIEPADLSELSHEAISALIRDTLQVDAFAEQRISPIRYRGRRLAETLELALFVCPKCLSLATLRSRDDRFFCPCGLTVRYTEFGFFEPVDAWSQAARDRQNGGVFHSSVAEWDAWQRERLQTLLDQPCRDENDDRPLFADDRQILLLCERATRSQQIGVGRLALFCDRLVFTDQAGAVHRFALTDLSRMIVHGQQTLQFTDQTGAVWEVRTRERRSAYKYLIVFYLLQQKLKGETHGFYGI